MPNRKLLERVRNKLLLTSLGIICLALQKPCFLAAQSAGARPQSAPAGNPAPAINPARAVNLAPAILVEIKCKSGTADRWLADFEKEILPSIQDVIQNGGEITHFSYVESVLPGSSFEFILIYQMKSFGSLDRKAPWPHYVALARRLGQARATEVLTEMGGWEESVRVTLVRTSPGAP